MTKEDASIQLMIGEEKAVAGHLVKVTKGAGKRRVKVTIKPDPSCKPKATDAQSRQRRQ